MFDDDFIWGGGAPSVSIEGAGLRSDWHRWEERHGLQPSMGGNGFRERSVEDFALFAEHGLRHVRLTIEWARIEPFPGRPDLQELELVEERLQSARDAGLSIWATLQDGSLPGWFSDDTDGFRTSHGVSIHWSRHVDRMAEMFDPLVSVWLPVVDPIGWAVRSHHIGSRPPGRKTLDKTQDAIEGVVEATFDAHRLLASGPTPVVGDFKLPTIHAAQPHAEEQRQYWDAVIWESWTRAISDGVLEWPWKGPVERPDMAGAFNAIGVGIASPLEVDASGSLDACSGGGRRDASGHLLIPDQLGEALQRAAESLDGKDLLVTGMGVATEDDGWREQLFEGWLDQIAAALADGLPVKGAFLEPLIDGYDVSSATAADGGVFNRSREPKPSLGWIAAQQ